MSNPSTPARPVRVDVVLGTRPEAIKLAPVIAALRECPFTQPRIISTGQHPELVREILGYFGQRPDVELGLMSRGQSLNDLVSRAIQRLGKQFLEDRPDLAVVQGDTSSAFAGALAAFHEHVPVGHVEAGLRSGDLGLPFPEEANRVLIGRIARLHFAPTPRAARNLLSEGTDPDHVHVYGNTVIDALRHLGRSDFEASRLKEFKVPDEARLVLVTAHRRENWGSPFAAICRAVRDLAEGHGDVHVVFVTHPNPELQSVAYTSLSGHDRIHLAPPLPYRDFVRLLDRCELALSDSGGVQEEATTLGKPVVLLRDTTERPEGVDAGTVQMVGTDPKQILEATRALLDDPRAYERAARATDCFGDGCTSERIVGAIGHFFDRCTLPEPFESETAGSSWPREAATVDADVIFPVASS